MKGKEYDVQGIKMTVFGRLNKIAIPKKQSDKRSTWQKEKNMMLKKKKRNDCVWETQQNCDAQNRGIK